MLQPSDAFMAEAMKLSNSPILRMRIWPDKGPQRRLKSESDWAAVDDPAIASDSNISTSRKPGAIVLAEGNPAAITGSGFTGLVAHRTEYEMHVVSHWHTGGNNITGHYPVHDYFSYHVIKPIREVLLPFTSGTTFLMDVARVVAENSGNVASSVTMRVLDVNGNQVGNRGVTAIAAASGQVTLDVSGLAASLRKGGSYSLAVGCTVPTSYHHAFFTTAISTVILDVFSYDISAYTHHLALAGGDGFVIGGNTGYQAAGQANRILDVGAIPGGDGNVYLRDIVPIGADPTSMDVTLYFTDSAAVAASGSLGGWTLHGVVNAGDAIPAHRYWWAVIDMTANTALDETPELLELTISYIGDALTISEQMEKALVSGYSDRYQLSAYAGLLSMGTASAKLTPKAEKAMTGKINIGLGDEDVVNGLYNKPLRGRPLEMQAGYVGIEDSLDVFSGIALDISVSSPGKHSLSALDPIELADVLIPREKAGPAWAGVDDYSISDIIIYGTNQWLALQASGPGNGGAVTPGTNALVWQDQGTVWLNIGYTAATNGGVEWHLADIVKDILMNRVNLSTQRINLQSIAQFKTLYPNRTGSRVITKPVKAFAMLTELAWLLEAQWVVRGGQLTLHPEPTLDALVNETIGKDEIKANARYRRGFTEMKNESVIITTYSGEGDGSEQFSGGVVVADAASVEEFEMVSLDVFYDKWNVPESELLEISTNTVNRWSNGRRWCSCRADMRFIRLEPGDVVEYNSIDLPRGDPGPYKMMVTGKDILSWDDQHLKFDLLEVR